MLLVLLTVRGGGRKVQYSYGDVTCGETERTWPGCCKEDPPIDSDSGEVWVVSRQYSIAVRCEWRSGCDVLIVVCVYPRAW